MGQDKQRAATISHISTVIWSLAGSMPRNKSDDIAEALLDDLAGRNLSLVPSALLAQMAAALEEVQKQFECPARNTNRGRAYREGVAISMDVREQVSNAVTAARTLSPDPQWQRVPEGWVVVPEVPSPEILLIIADNSKLALDRYLAFIAAGKRARGEG